jgi:prepilin-type N-terminal cleavage/methylation domain-containing protein
MKGQKGFTAIELIVSVMITGIIGLTAGMATNQFVTQSTRNSDYTAASRHVMNALFWVSRDAQMSQNITTAGTTGLPLTLGWTEWDNSVHQAVYNIDGDKLVRSYSIDDGTTAETVVAQYVNSTSQNTTCQYDGSILTVKVTATVGDGAHALSVSKVKEIAPRPGL